eukprot:scaffold27037_cov30-Tisochrysis_lutea.AAC.1
MSSGMTSDVSDDLEATMTGSVPADKSRPRCSSGGGKCIAAFVGEASSAWPCGNPSTGGAISVLNDHSWAWPRAASESALEPFGETVACCGTAVGAGALIACTTEIGPLVLAATARGAGCPFEFASS